LNKILDASDPDKLRFSTAALPARERLTLFREIFGRGLLNMDIVPLEENGWAECEFRMLPGANIMWGGNSAYRFEKAREPALESDDLIMVWVTTPMRGMFRQRNREISLGEGSTWLLSCEHHTVTENVDPVRHVNVKVPRAALEPLVPNIDDALMRSIQPDAEAVRLLKTYVEILGRENALRDATLQQAMALHICDLIALAAGTTRDGAQLAQERGLNAARLAAVRKLVLENLWDQNFSVKTAAAIQGVTPRYIQMLFESAGTTFSTFLLEQRLAFVHRRLRDPSLVARSIGALALDAGFGDLSYFNRVFRRAYGETPSDVRQRALSAGPRGRSRPDL
jgi:AraC-like DNA-binding protein